MRLDGIINSMDMSSRKLREMVKNREAWHAAVHRVMKSWTEKQQGLVHNKFLTGELREGDGERGEKEGVRERRERESTKMLHPIPVIAGPYQIHQLL